MAEYYGNYYGDFQCEATGGCPTFFVVDWDNKVAWLEPNDTCFDENDSNDIKLLKEAQALCSAWGRRQFANETALRNMLRNLGEEAFENSWESCEFDFYNRTPCVKTSLSEKISEAASYVSKEQGCGHKGTDLEL